MHMSKLAATDLMSLEQYARERPAFRAQVLEHKRARRLAVGPNVTWCFEDRLTIQYQVQEMLRAERIFEPAGIAEELEAYNPLIPDGSNWKATLLIEFPKPAERGTGARAAEGHRGALLGAGGGSAAGVRDRRRGPRARERREDLRGAFPALRAHAGDDRGPACRGRARLPASITSTTAIHWRPCLHRCAQRWSLICPGGVRNAPFRASLASAKIARARARWRGNFSRPAALIMETSRTG